MPPRTTACILSVACAVLVAACQGETGEAGEEALRAIAVTQAEARRQLIEDTETSLGTVDAKSAPQIAAEVSGVVTGIYVESGDKVEGEAVLARIDASDYEIEQTRAAAQLERLDILLAQQEREIVRQRRLRDQGHISRAALEEREANVAALRQELSAARSDLDSAERNLRRTEIRAPYDGVILNRLISEGDFVDSGTALFEMARAGIMLVQIPVPETLVDRLEPGLAVRLTGSARNGAPVVGTVTQIRPQVGESSRAITVVAEIENPGGWHVGSSVNAEIVLEERDSIAVPAQAVVRRAAGSVVYVIDGNLARERTVTVGRRVGERVEILDGLAEGEQVAVDGAGFLSDGSAVEASPHVEEEEEIADAAPGAVPEPR
jgi:RND family efflux transporter MFP subunit